MKTTQFHGAHTALVTPMRQGAVHLEDTRRLVDMQIAGGIHGLVAVGTTGESPTLDTGEHLAFIRLIVELAQHRVPVIAGTGSNSTHEAIELTREADREGADAFLLVAPYYNKPNQEGLFRHFAAIAETTSKPIILYSIPSRCGIEIGPETQARLHKAFPHIIGVKEAGGACDRVSQLRQDIGPDYLILSGDDSLTLPFMACGAKGVISVASNIIPAQIARMVTLALDNHYDQASQIHHQYFPLFRNLFIEPNPVPVKQALHDLGILGEASTRLPLTPMSEAHLTLLRQTLRRTGVLPS